MKVKKVQEAQAQRSTLEKWEEVCEYLHIELDEIQAFRACIRVSSQEHLTKIKELLELPSTATWEDVHIWSMGQGGQDVVAAVAQDAGLPPSSFPEIQLARLRREVEEYYRELEMERYIP